MSYSSRIPGNIATQRTGRNRYEEKGWRRFFLTDPRCRVQNDQGVTVSSSAAAPCSVDESTGNTVITFLSGHDGGTNSYPSGANYGGGGGGGAGTVGCPGKNNVNAPTQYDTTALTGNGGAGLAYSLSGSSVYYCGGGGCGGNAHGPANNPGAYGGRGGGGDGKGGSLGVSNANGEANYGGGGGGACANNNPTYPGQTSGSGGSGVVIVAYDV